MSTLAEEMRAAVLLIRRAAAASRSMAAVEIIGPALDHLQAVAGYHEQMAKVAALEAELSARTAERDALRTALERCASFLREWDDGENLSPEKGWNFAEFEAEHAAIRSALQPSKTEK